MTGIRIETDSLGPIEVAADRLWGAQTQRSLLYFSIGHERMPPEMIGAYAVLKQAAATANQQLGHLAPDLHALIKTAYAEIEAEQHNEMSPLHVWMTGGSTPFNMMVNEVISKLTKIAHDIRSLAAARAPDRANCSCRRTSLARRSCPARSTPHRRKR